MATPARTGSQCAPLLSHMRSPAPSCLGERFANRGLAGRGLYIWFIVTCIAPRVTTVDSV